MVPINSANKDNPDNGANVGALEIYEPMAAIVVFPENIRPSPKATSAAEGPGSVSRHPFSQAISVICISPSKSPLVLTV